MKLTRFFATMALVACFTTSAFAQESDFEFTPYFAGYFNTFYTNTTAEAAGVAGDATSDFIFNIASSTVFGAEMSYGNLSSVVELQLDPEFISLAVLSYSYADNQAISFGVDGTFASYSNFSQVSDDWNSLVNYGALNDNSRPMVKWSGWGVNFAVIAGAGLDVSGIDFGVEAFTLLAEGLVTNNFFTTANYYSNIPRFELSYDIDTQVFVGSVFASYAPYLMDFTMTDADATTDNLLVNSYSVGAGGQLILGGLTVDAGVYYGANLALSGYLDAPTPLLSPTQNTAGINDGFDVENVTSLGGALSVAYALSDTFIPSIGAGYSSSSLTEFTNEKFAVYGNVYIYLTDWLLIAPEVAYTKSTDTGLAMDTTSEGAIHVGFITEFAF